MVASCVLGPVSVNRGNGRRSDGMTVFMFYAGKWVVLDNATCVEFLASAISVKWTTNRICVYIYVCVY